AFAGIVNYLQNCNSTLTSLPNTYAYSYFQGQICARHQIQGGEKDILSKTGVTGMWHVASAREE
ncbi:unnamed protein product, partial [Ceratitis capitata]